MRNDGLPHPNELFCEEDSSWRQKAACRNSDPDIFFPERGGDAEQRVAYAKGVCKRCPVTTECLQYAMDTRQKDGVWGNTSPKERAAMRRHGLRAVDVIHKLEEFPVSRRSTSISRLGSSLGRGSSGS